MMKTLFSIVSVCTVVALAWAPCSHAATTVTLIDGQTLEAEVLFEHPSAPLLVMRSPRNASLQSLPIALIHKVGSETHSAKRELTADEAEMLERDGHWVEEASDGQIGKFATETWDRQPVAVWAKPGTSGDGLNPENWLDESGKPYSKDLWSTQTNKEGNKSGGFPGDLLLPRADKAYMVLQAGNRDHLGSYDLRHLTVEANADYRIRYWIHGNLWMKDGSKLGGKTQTGGLGSGDLNKHTVLRFCNYHPEDRPKDIPEDLAWTKAPDISHWVWIDTGERGSIEVVGMTGGPSDRLSLRVGTLIISEDSFIGNGNRGCFFSEQGTTTVLLDGARIGCPDPVTRGSGGNTMGTYGIAGTLMFGTPEHPLTRDLVFSACYYPKDKVSTSPNVSQRTHGASFVLGKSGRMVVNSSDPEKVRVIFRGRDKRIAFSQYALPREHWKLLKENPAAIYEQGYAPTGVAAVFLGETDFNGVVFDDFYEGGIIVDPRARKRWKNVSFGEGNHAEPEKLFAPLK